MAFTDKFLCIYSSPFHLAMAQSKDGGLNTLCHSCGFDYQQSVLCL